MAHYPYLILGGGMAADAAVCGIRELDAVRPIGLIGEETDPPYARPPLSKGLWKGDPLESVWRNTAEHGVDLLLGRRGARGRGERGGEEAKSDETEATGGCAGFDHDVGARRTVCATGRSMKLHAISG